MLGVAAVVLAGTNAIAEEGSSRDITLAGVTLRPGVEADIHVKVFVNGRSDCEGKVLLAVPGCAHTAATWEPFARAIFEDDQTGRTVCQVAALDFPGHGGSSLPRGVRFWDLALADYASVLGAALERLPRLGVRPSAIVAHSQGGLIVQLTQQSLLARGTNLRRKFRIKQVVLLSSVGPSEMPWDYVDNGTAARLMSAFVSADRQRGAYVAFPDAAWPTVFFSDLSGAVAPGAPDPSIVAAYNAPAPLFAALEVVGFLPFRRPHVDAGVFGPGAGTTLGVVSYEQDTIIRPGENRMLYEHLTGDGSGSGFVEVPGAAAVHDLHVLDPRLLLDYLGSAGLVELL